MNNTISLIIALIIGLLLGYLIGVETNNSEEVEMHDTEENVEMHEGEEMMEEEMMEDEGDVMGDSTEESVVVVPGTNSVSVMNQPAGSMVSVSNISLSEDSWITVVENPDTNPWILGAQWLPAGTHVGASVDLVRAEGTISGNSYSVMIRQDNGDRSFDKETDLLVADSAGNLISVPFMAL